MGEKRKNEFAKYVRTDSKKNVTRSSVELREGHDPKKVVSLISDLLGLFTYNGPKNVAPSPEKGDSPSPKKQKTTGLEYGTSPNNVSESMAAPVTPPAKSTGNRPSTPPSVLSTQRFIISTDSSPIMHSNGIYRQILQYPEVQGAFDSAKSRLKSILLEKMKKNAGLESEEVMVESGLETAASIDLLKLFGASTQELEKIGERAHSGAMMLQEGLKKVKEGKGILEQAFTDVSKNIK